MMFSFEILFGTQNPELSRYEKKKGKIRPSDFALLFSF